MRRSAVIAAAGLLAPAAVLTASSASRPSPPAVTSTAPSAPAAPRTAGLVSDAGFRTPYSALVGFDPRTDTLVVQRDGKAELAGVGAHDGTVRWRRPLNPGNTFTTVLWSQRDLSAGVVFMNTLRRGAGELIAVSTGTGDIQWRVPLTDRTMAAAAGGVLLLAEPGQGTLSALDSGTGERIWRAELPHGCDVVTVAGDSTTVAVQLRCENRTELQIRDAGDGTLRAQTTLEIAVEAPADGIGLLVRDGATVVRGARSFQVFAPDGRRLADRQAEGCYEFCDIVVEDGTALVAHSGSVAGHPGGALEAIALADGHTRWRTGLAVDALVRSGGHLYAVGPAPDPVPFLAVAAVTADGAGPGLATQVPALPGARPDVLVTGALADGEPDDAGSGTGRRGTQPRSGRTHPALLLARPAGDDLGLEWHRIAAQTRPPAGPLGGAPAAEWPDACAVAAAAELSTSLPGARSVPSGGAAGLPPGRCAVEGDGGSFTVETLWSGPDAAERWNRLTGTAGDLRPLDVDGADEAVRSQAAGVVRILMRVGRVIVAVTTTTGASAAGRAAARIAGDLGSPRRR